ncbi:MAG: cupredoxin domain-containing protein [Microthrixaceae bacterium]
MRTTTRLIATLLASSLTLFACGGEEKIGDDITISPDGEGGALRDPARTTTTLPGDIEEQLGTSTTAPGGSDGVTNTTVAPTATTEAPDVILVQDDEQGAYFDPYAYQIAVNRPLVFRNVGTKARVIVFDDLRVKSPEIEPGGEWVYVFDKKGNFKFRDETRPYATNGQVQVF